MSHTAQLSEEMRDCIRNCQECHSVCAETTAYCLEEAAGTLRRTTSSCFSIAHKSVPPARISCYGCLSFTVAFVTSAPPFVGNVLTVANASRQPTA
jgi:hypothetical protein